MYKVILPYTESSNPFKKFEIAYTIEAEDREAALQKAEREFFAYLQYNSAAWVRTIDRDQIRVWRISADPDLPKTPQSIDELANDLEGKDPETIYRILIALGQLEDTAASSRIIPLLRHADEQVAALAAETLGKIGDSANLPLLLALFTSTTGSRLKASILSAVGRLARARDPIQDVLAQALGDPDSRVRANAVEVIERLKIPSSGRLLVPLLADADNRVRANVLKALWTSHDRRTLAQTLHGMVDNTNPWMRASAAFVLQHIDIDDRIRILGQLSTDPDPVVQNAAWRGLSSFSDPDCIPPWLSYLFRHRDVDPEPIFSKIEHLGEPAITAILAWEARHKDMRRNLRPLWERLELAIFQRQGWVAWGRLKALRLFHPRP